MDAEPSTGAKSIHCRSPWFLHYESHYDGPENGAYFGRSGSICVPTFNPMNGRILG
jgi:hypothetical protein